jgi:hypothetical protein
VLHFHSDLADGEEMGYGDMFLGLGIYDGGRRKPGDATFRANIGRKSKIKKNSLPPAVKIRI